MNLKQIQQEQKEWAEHNFPNQEAWENVIGMQEELGELGHAFLKRHQGIRGEVDEHEAELKDAAADLVIYLLGFCNKEGIDLQSTLEDVWCDVRTRDWQRHPKNGISE